MITDIKPPRFDWIGAIVIALAVAPFAWFVLALLLSL